RGEGTREPRDLAPATASVGSLGAMSASVVIPTTLRRASTVAAVSSALAAVSRLDGGEVIVVANGPRAGRRRLELRSPLLRVLESPEGQVASARNLGLREAANDVV